MKSNKLKIKSEYINFIPREISIIGPSLGIKDTVNL